MKVALGTFARSGIEARLGRENIAAGVQIALRHYTQRLRSGWKPPEFPRFRREQPDRPTLDLVVDREVEEALQREAQALHGVSVEQLAGHAVLVYLADMDLDTNAACERRRRPLARI